MKIMKRQEFLATPAGTLYQEYTPCIFGPLLIKYQIIGKNDFAVQELTECAIACFGSHDMVKILEDAEVNGTSVQMDFDCCGREGLYPDDSALYAVWEADDIQALINKLTECIS